MAFIATLMGVIGFGLSHGINPSHGWPVASLYAMRSKRPLFSGVISSSIIAAAHFISSIAVVAVYVIVIGSLAIQIPEVYMRWSHLFYFSITSFLLQKKMVTKYFLCQHKEYLLHRLAR